MAVFADLPNELILEVWGYIISPKDVESFALVSKRIFNASARFVKEHNDLKKRYSNSDWFSYGGKNTPAMLLETMILHPRIALYIKELALETTRDCTWSSISGAYSVNLTDVFERMFRASRLVAASQVEHWIANLKRGNKDTVMALILMQLTNLEKFSFRYKGIMNLYLLNVLRWITQPSAAIAQSGQPLPEKRIDGILHDGFTKFSTFYNVSDLRIRFTRISLDVLSQLLRSTKALETFTYGPCWPHEIEACDLCDELVKSSEYSLRKLVIRGNIGKTRMADLTKFRRLKVLRMEFGILLGSAGPACANLADALPMSIQDVWLFDDDDWEAVSLETIRRLILEMVKSKMECLPKLRVLKFVFYRYGKEFKLKMDLLSDLQAQATEVGVYLGAVPWPCIE